MQISSFFSNSRACLEYVFLYSHWIKNLLWTEMVYQCLMKFASSCLTDGTVRTFCTTSTMITVQCSPQTFLLNAGRFECYFTLVKYVPRRLHLSRSLRSWVIHDLNHSGHIMQDELTLHAGIKWPFNRYEYFQILSLHYTVLNNHGVLYFYNYNYIRRVEELQPKNLQESSIYILSALVSTYISGELVFLFTTVHYS